MQAREDGMSAYHMTPNVRRLAYLDHLGLTTSRGSQQADGQWSVRTEVLGSLEQRIEYGPTAEAAAGQMIATLELAGVYVPEPPEDFSGFRPLDGQP